MSEPVTAPPGAPESDVVAETLPSTQAGRKVIRGSALRGAGYAAGIAFGLLSTPFLIRHLGVADYGRYVTVVSLVAIVQGLTDAGLTSTGVREFATSTPHEREQLMRNLLGIRILLAAGGVGAAVAFAGVAGYGGNLVAGAALAGAAVFATSIQSTFFVPLLAELRLGLVTALELLRQGATALIIVAGVIAGAGLLTFFGAPIVPGVLALALTGAIVAGSTPIRPSFDRTSWLPLVRATLPVAVASIAVIVYYRVAIIVMSLIASERQTGYFSVSFRIVEVLIMVPNLLVSTVFPVLAHAARADDRRLMYVLQRLFDISIIGGVWLALSTVAGARLAVNVIAGSKFHSSIDVLKLQGVALGATFLVFAWGYALLALRRTRATIVANVFAVAVAVAGTLVLGGLYGAKGAAVAMIAAEVTLAAAYGVSLARAIHLHVPLQMIWRVAVAVGLAAAAALLTGIPDAALVPVTTIVYFGVLVLLRAFPSELWDALRLKTSA